MRLDHGSLGVERRRPRRRTSRRDDCAGDGDCGDDLKFSVRLATWLPHVDARTGFAALPADQLERCRID